SAQSQHHVMALEAGADDVIHLVDVHQIFIRTHSLLRRQSWNSKRLHSSTFHFGDIHINFDTHEVFRQGQLLQLTALELKLLRYFIQNRNRVIERKELLSEVWNLHNYPNTRTVDNFIMRLRRLFEPKPNRPMYFLSIRGSGYKFQSEVREFLA
ncbi:MAG: response regulator transcription factor, partial [Myxococcota bacterium]|nr:response regulator transcription factor [Myxococcota bacterium]